MKAYNKRIECIASWDTRGSVTPIRFKFHDKVYGHIEICYKNINKHAGNPMHCFSCVATSKGKKFPCELRYEVNTCFWYLYKI